MAENHGGGEYGPGWRDVQNACTELIERYNVFIELAIVPPIKKVDGTGYSSFQAVARVSRRSQKQIRWLAASRAYGRGGALKTVTAALHLALTELYARLEEDEATALAQATF